MKSNADVVKAFYDGKSASNRNMESTGNRLYSYYTCIAERLNDGTLVLNKTKYSTSTSKQQNLLKRGDIVLKNVPINSVRLSHLV